MGEAIFLHLGISFAQFNVTIIWDPDHIWKDYKIKSVLINDTTIKIYILWITKYDDKKLFEFNFNGHDTKVEMKIKSS